MTAEEAIAGLVLCACELLKSSRGALTEEASDAEVNGGFSPERFEALDKEQKKRGDAEFLSWKRSSKSVPAPDSGVDSEKAGAEREFLELLSRESQRRAERSGVTEEKRETLTPRRLSEYYERDSRRYDGGYERY